MNKLIIGISGKRQSGKDSTANYIKDYINLKDDTYYGRCQIYSFADKLKRDVCINLLGLTEKQCYGSNDDKETLTHLKWEDMPGNVKIEYNSDDYWDYPKLVPDKTGVMTAREVMQYVGTEIFRKMYSSVWVDALIRQIEQDNNDIAIIADLRFEDEARAIKKVGGKLWRFTRNKFPSDHESETGLDNWDEWDFILYNEDMTLETQLKWCLEEYKHISPNELSPYLGVETVTINGPK